MRNSTLWVKVKSPFQSQYERRSLWKKWLEHLGAISVVISFIAALMGFGLIWAYLQIIQMPDLFFPAISSNPIISFALTLLMLLVVFAGAILLFMPAIVVVLWEIEFQVKLSLREKCGLWFSQIIFLLADIYIQPFSEELIDVLVLSVVMVAISYFVVRDRRSKTNGFNLIAFILLSGIFGLYWIFGLLFLYREIAGANPETDVRLYFGFALLPLAPVLLQWLFEGELKISKATKLLLGFLACFIVIAVLIPKQTIYTTLTLAGIRQKSQDSRYYWVDEKYKRSISDNQSFGVVAKPGWNVWESISDEGGTYVFGYKLFSLSDVTVLCPRHDTESAADPDNKCFQVDNDDIRLMPRSFRSRI